MLLIMALKTLHYLELMLAIHVFVNIQKKIDDNRYWQYKTMQICRNTGPRFATCYQIGWNATENPHFY